MQLEFAAVPPIPCRMTLPSAKRGIKTFCYVTTETLARTETAITTGHKERYIKGAFSGRESKGPRAASSRDTGYFQASGMGTMDISFPRKMTRNELIPFPVIGGEFRGRTTALQK